MKTNSRYSQDISRVEIQRNVLGERFLGMIYIPIFALVLSPQCLELWRDIHRCFSIREILTDRPSLQSAKGLVGNQSWVAFSKTLVHGF